MESTVPESSHTNSQTQPEPLSEKPLENSMLELYSKACLSLNEEQLEASTYLTGPLLVVAGPGSGKTRVITQRIAALVGSGTNPESILAVTFTNKAAEEMRERVSAQLENYFDPSRIKRMWVCTFHSACVRILRSHATLIDRSTNFSITDSANSKKILSRILPSELASQARDFQSQISLAKNKLLSPTMVIDNKWHPQLPKIWRDYQKELLAQNLFDFDDLLVNTLTILASYPEVAEQYQARFSHILVDEFQDTNPVQYAILKHLSKYNVCVVGDQDQSVYGWRGSTPSIMETFVQDWPETKVVILAENYRSTPEILSVAQSVIAQNPSATRGELLTNNSSLGPVKILEASSDLSEADYVADYIASSTNPYKSYAIIYRTKAQSREFEKALVSRTIPYFIVGDVSFYERSEVRDALAYLRLSLNPFDREALRRASSVPRIGIGATTLNKLFALADLTGSTPIEAFEEGYLEFSLRARTILTEFFSKISSIYAACEYGPLKALETIYKIDKFVEASTDKEGSSITARRENLSQLVTAAAQFVAGHSVNYSSEMLDNMDNVSISEAFLAESALLGTAREEQEVCQLMTAHASKGKEFDHVFVVGVEDGFFPHYNSTDSAEEIQEERRLLFVALSRARLSLTITWASTRSIFASRTDRIRSPFLNASDPFVTPVVQAYKRNYFNNKRGPQTKSIKVVNKVQKTTTVLGGPRVKSSDLTVGARINHNLYGEGVVISFDSEFVVVNFSSKNAHKKLMLTLAPLSLLT